MFTVDHLGWDNREIASVGSSLADPTADFVFCLLEVDAPRIIVISEVKHGSTGAPPAKLKQKLTCVTTVPYSECDVTSRPGPGNVKRCGGMHRADSDVTVLAVADHIPPGSTDVVCADDDLPIRVVVDADVVTAAAKSSEPAELVKVCNDPLVRVIVSL